MPAASTHRERRTTVHLVELIDTVHGLAWSKLGLPVTSLPRNPDLSVAELQPATHGSLHGLHLRHGDHRECQSGGEGNDVLIGNAIANWMQGGLGPGHLHGQGVQRTFVDGGAGSDILILGCRHCRRAGASFRSRLRPRPAQQGGFLAGRRRTDRHRAGQAHRRSVCLRHPRADADRCGRQGLAGRSAVPCRLWPDAQPGGAQPVEPRRPIRSRTWAIWGRR